jgi:hypothetical protein
MVMKRSSPTTLTTTRRPAFRRIYNNTTGNSNAAHGFQALYNNISGSSNTANGFYALFSNTTSSYNTAAGAFALESNTYGDANTANGYSALGNNTTALTTRPSVFKRSLMAQRVAATRPSVLRTLLNATGGSNIALGESAGINLTTGKNNIDLGNKGVAGESNTIRVGKKGTQTSAFVAGISGVAVAGGVGVLIDANGHLGTVVSSARYKDNIQPMAKASEPILALKPVTFRYKPELDPQAYSAIRPRS